MNIIQSKHPESITPFGLTLLKDVSRENHTLSMSNATISADEYNSSISDPIDLNNYREESKKN